MMRAGGKLSEHSYMSVVLEKRALYELRQHNMCECVACCACTQMCVCVCVGVRNCPSRSGTAGCWLVCQESICVCVYACSASACVYQSLLVYMPASISCRVPCAISTVTRLMMAVLLCFVSYAWVFPSLPPLQHSHPASCQKRGNHPSVLLCNIRTLQVKRQLFRAIKRAVGEREHKTGLKLKLLFNLMSLRDHYNTEQYNLAFICIGGTS